MNSESAADRPAFFITGTDTSCGKTVVSAALLRALRLRGQRTAGMKPVATGSRMTAAGLRNDDAELLLNESTAEISYDDVNPYAFVPPIAPHVAAAEAGVPLDTARITRAFAACRRSADVVIVEGVGGWMVPLDERRSLCDLVQALGLPVILVVGLKLGCINHALLTARAIRDDGCTLAGWIGNHVTTDYPRVEASLALLTERIGAPLLGVLPWRDPFDVGTLAAALATPALETLIGARQG